MTRRSPHPPPPLLILIAGPTGVGKSALALELALGIRGEIVNADSMQVYRLMDIGTAKPSAAERALVRHHMLDVADPDEPFDAARYQRLADRVIRDLGERRVLPVVVGGTGLYLKSLVHGLCRAHPGNETIRRELLQELEHRGLPQLYQELALHDPRAAARIHPHDRQRILRAVEVYRLTGQPLSDWQQQHGFGPKRYQAVKIFLYREREELYRRIDQRAQAMLAAGLVEEVAGLLARGYGPGLKAMQALGYRQVTAHLRGLHSLEEALRQMQRATRHYAKRQLTWFRADPDYHWVHAADGDALRRRLEPLLPRR